MQDWKVIARRLKADGKSWREITYAVMPCFSDTPPYDTAKDRVRMLFRNTPEYKAKNAPPDAADHPTSTEYKQDGTVVYDKLIEIMEGEEITPEVIMKAHNITPGKWEVVSYRNNYWHSQVKGGKRLVMYQSRLVVKPKKQGVSYEQIDAFFNDMMQRYERPARLAPRHTGGGCMAEVNIADLHFGKLCWHGDTGNNFDYKIAREMFLQIVSDICGELQNKPLDFIRFVWANDFFNSDTTSKTTTAGTPQDTDIRWQKLFSVGCEMLIAAVDMLAQVAPVETFYTPSNHDEMTGYYAIKMLEAWFRNDERVRVDTDARTRKYYLYGNVLIGYTHGDKEKPRNLQMVMPNEAREMWGKAKYCEMHAAHLHSEHAINEANGVIVRRIASPTATDTWHYESGYVGAVRKAQTFIYDKERGLLQTINTPIQDFGHVGAG